MRKSERKAQIEIIQTALMTKFPQVSRIRFYGLNVEIYEAVNQKP